MAGSGAPVESGWKKTLGADLGASLVVFLVALPLCVGVAVASGVPAELGIITGIVGGLVVGLLPGSSLQVSGPAAGLTVLVASSVAQFGVAALGVIVLGAGLVQIALGVSKLGTWFQAISPSVVQGMLAGIGLVLILGQVYLVGGLEQPSSVGEKVLGIPGLMHQLVSTPTGLSGLLLAIGTIGVLAAWTKLPRRWRFLPLGVIPGALVAVVLAACVTWALSLPVKRIEVGSLLSAVSPPELGMWTMLPAMAGAILTFALVASAESLFSAAAVDRMHDGPKTQYNKELLAQGVGNSVCGLLGALPMTAVIVRSSANVQAGAKTKLARVLHGVWLLLFVAALPGILNYIPTAALGALLLHAGWKLLEPQRVLQLARTNRAEAGVLVLTAVGIVATDLLLGTLIGLAAAIVKSAWDTSRLHVDTKEHDDHVRLKLGGNATFLRLPRLLEHLERVPHTERVHLDLTTVRHLDMACQQAVEQWAHQRRKRNCSVEIELAAGVH